ncbi:MAG: RNA chaperone Hfq [Gammaproteobacteria bacterium]
MNTTENIFLKTLNEEEELIYIYLINGIRLDGYLIAYGTDVFVLASDLKATHCQLIYKQAVATVQKCTVGSKNYLKQLHSSRLKQEKIMQQ